MIPVLYEKDATRFSNFGLGFLPAWVRDSVEVVEERNGEYYLQGELPVGGLHADLLAIDRIIYCAPGPGKPPQPFRIQEIAKEKGSDTLKVYAPHVSYQLTQTAILPVSGGNPPKYATAQAAIDALWRDCRPSMTGVFTAESDITLSSAKPIEFENPISLRAAIGGTEGSLIDVFGGELEWDHWTVRLLASRGRVTNKKIRYRANMDGLSFETDARSLVTAYIGYVKYDGATVFGNIVYLDGSSDFAYPRMESIDLTDQFKDSEYLPTSSQIEAATRAAISGGAKLRTSIEVTAVPEELQDVELCDTVTVVHPGYALNQQAKVVKTVYDPIDERFKSITIGEIHKTITATIADLIRGLQKAGNVK